MRIGIPPDSCRSALQASSGQGQGHQGLIVEPTSTTGAGNFAIGVEAGSGQGAQQLLHTLELPSAEALSSTERRATQSKRSMPIGAAPASPAQRTQRGRRPLDSPWIVGSGTRAAPGEGSVLAATGVEAAPNDEGMMRGMGTRDDATGGAPRLRPRGSPRLSPAGAAAGRRRRPGPDRDWRARSPRCGGGPGPCGRPPLRPARGAGNPPPRWGCRG